VFANRTALLSHCKAFALGHTVSDAVKNANQRTRLLEKRRNLMNDWANFIDLSLAN
jgi:hypothetical protein